MIRRIIQVAAQTGETDIIALCNDGTLWGMTNGTWAQFPAIPQNWSNESVEKQWSELVDANAKVRTLEQQVAEVRELSTKVLAEPNIGKAARRIQERLDEIVGVDNG